MSIGILRDRTTNGVVMVNPSNIDETISARSAVKNRTIGDNRHHVFPTSFNQVLMRNKVQKDGSFISANENCSVNFSCSNLANAQEAWNNMKTNVDKAFADHPHVFVGIPMPLSASDIIFPDVSK